MTAAVLQVVHFGRCWSHWIAAHGGAASVSDSTYLTAAERFVQAFLAGTAGPADGQAARPEGSFQGVLLAVDVKDGLLREVRICGWKTSCSCCFGMGSGTLVETQSKLPDPHHTQPGVCIGWYTYIAY